MLCPSTSPDLYPSTVSMRGFTKRRRPSASIRATISEILWMRVRNHLWQLDACMTAATRIPEQKETVTFQTWLASLRRLLCDMDSRRVRKVAVGNAGVYIPIWTDLLNSTDVPAPLPIPPMHSSVLVMKKGVRLSTPSVCQRSYLESEASLALDSRNASLTSERKRFELSLRGPRPISVSWAETGFP
jgi:hypothetical protein